jgi:hypothetical protein
MLWGDFVGDIDLSHWEWDESAIRKEEIVEWDDEYDMGVIYVSKRQVEDSPYLHIIASEDGWVLIYWGDFAKVERIGGIYVGVVHSKWGYQPEFWSANENEALKWFDKRKLQVRRR